MYRIPNFARMDLAFIRYVYALVILCLGVNAAGAQISIDQKSIPQVGDSLFYKTVSFPERRIIIATGNDVLWDYSNMQTPFLSVVRFDENITEAGISEGDISMYEDGKFKYLLKNSDNLELIAQNSELIDGKISIFEKPEILRPATLKLGDENLILSSSYEIFSQEEIPETLRNRVSKIILPLKITTNSTIRTSVDAAGTLVLPWGAEEALLMKVDITKSIECTYQENGQWVSLSEEQLAFLDLNYKQSSIDYHFYSKESKLPLMIIDRDENNTITSIKYQVKKVGQKDIEKGSGKKEIVAYPNPTFGRIKFEFLNYPAGNYSVEVKSVLGTKLWTQSYNLEENGVINEDFSFLKRSTYLYIITDQYGNKLTTKRLVIITP